MNKILQADIQEEIAEIDLDNGEMAMELRYGTTI
jgi:hypothetical protein